MKEPNQFEDIVPGRPSAAELRAMALRQQQQIDSQHQLLAAKEQRLRFLKAQEARGAAAAAEGERLRRLRERVEAQESKLRRLRALRGQVDLQKTYNVTLSNDLDSIRALFSEKEKELSLAVAKVEALTRQLEELRRDRRGLNLIANNGNNQPSSPAARELEKLRRELMYRNQLSLQQDARLHLQREALQQRQAELRSVDQRILELQGRLQRKKAANLLLQQQQQNGTHVSSSNNNVQPANIHVRSSSTHIYPPQKNVRGNVAAVEPYNHTPQKSTSITTSNQQQQHQQIIQDLAMLKLKSSQQQQHSPTSNMAAESDETKLARQKQFSDHITPQQTQGLLTKNTSNNNNNNDVQNHQVKDSIIMDNGNEKQTSAQSTDLNGKKNELTNQTMPYNKFVANNSLNVGNSSLLSHKIISSVLSANNGSSTALAMKSNECDSEKAGEITGSNEMSTGHVNGTQIANSTPLNAINKSVAEPLNVATTTETEEKPAIKPKALHQIPSGNLVVPPRKPISSVAPTSIKNISQAPKVHMVAPNINVQASSIENDKSRPALPPKPNKNGNNNNININSNNNNNNNNNSNSSSSNQQVLSNESENASVNNENNLPIKAKPLTIKKQPLSEQPKLRSLTSNLKTIQFSTSRRIEMPPSFLFPEIATTELKDNSNNGDVNGNSMNQTSIISKLVNGNINLSNNLNNNNSQDSGSITSNDETDKSITPVSTPIQSDEKHVDSIVKRKRNIIGDNVKAKLARRVSFDPLALLLDASLEGELELVRKTAMQVPNPSAANDEGITALHNAICAGHLEIVKFLVQFGCDVNAQDSDGWTPLHCAASCNNLPMVRFLVESGACLFASTLSDHETPAEKCEEDEEGFDGCSEYLYSIQEKLGILNNGEVYAVFSYDAQQQDELKFSVNDKLTILRKGDESEREWWWARNIDGHEGYVPRNLFGLYPRIDPSMNQNYSE
ncbi:apoptosis-stimulating of p53 protein 2 isoform X3 [Chironomus tepperi]|uniref:apoptosis-stimulating of p53 protein 2 isoform X3 n=1 Tax=Chironomus tepperi TaxID=113505 RepID=UPI00391F8DF6